MTGPDPETAYRRSRLALAARIVLAGPVIGTLVVWGADFALGRMSQLFMALLLPPLFLVLLASGWVVGLLPAIVAAALWLFADDVLYTTSQRWIGVILVGGVTGAAVASPLVILSTQFRPLDVTLIMSTALAGIVALALTVRPWSER